MDNVTNVFKSRIKELRGSKNQSEVAKEIGISRSALSYYESGDRTPDINVLYSLAKYYDVTTDYLLGLSDTPKPDIESAAISDKLGLTQHSIDFLSNTNNIVRSESKEDYIFSFLLLYVVNLIIDDDGLLLDITTYLFSRFTHFSDFYDGGKYYPIANLELFDDFLKQGFSEDYDFFSSAYLLRINHNFQYLRNMYASDFSHIFLENPNMTYHETYLLLKEYFRKKEFGIVEFKNSKSS